MTPRLCGKALLDASVRFEESRRRGRVGVRVCGEDRWYWRDEVQAFCNVGTVSPYSTIC